MHNKKFISLRIKTLCVLLPVVVFFALFCFVVIRGGERLALTKSLTTRAESLGESLAILGTSSLSNPGDAILAAKFQKNVIHMADQPSVTAIEVVNNSAKVKASSVASDIGSVKNDDIIRKALGTPVPLTETLQLNGVDCLAAIVPIRSANNTLGLVIVYLSTDEIDQASAGLTRQLFGIIFVLIGCSLLFVVLISYWYGNPLLDLAAVADNMAQGKLETRADDRRSDELGLVASRLNNFSEHIQNFLASSQAEMLSKRERIHALRAFVDGVLAGDPSSQAPVEDIDEIGQLAMSLNELVRHLRTIRAAEEVLQNRFDESESTSADACPTIGNLGSVSEIRDGSASEHVQFPSNYVPRYYKNRFLPESDTVVAMSPFKTMPPPSLSSSQNSQSRPTKTPQSKGSEHLANGERQDSKNIHRASTSSAKPSRSTVVQVPVPPINPAKADARPLDRTPEQAQPTPAVPATAQPATSASKSVSVAPASNQAADPNQAETSAATSPESKPVPAVPISNQTTAPNHEAVSQTGAASMSKPNSPRSPVPATSKGHVADVVVIKPPVIPSTAQSAPPMPKSPTQGFVMSPSLDASMLRNGSTPYFGSTSSLSNSQIAYVDQFSRLGAGRTTLVATTGNEDSYPFLRSILSREGFNILHASTIEEMLEIAQLAKIDVIIVEFNNISGGNQQAVSKLRALPNGNNVSIIVLAASLLNSVDYDSKQGVIQVLIPNTDEELTVMVREALAEIVLVGGKNPFISG